MHFSFPQLITHISKTRAFTAGTILGSGTVSNEDPGRGISCLVERRMREQIESGAARTEAARASDSSWLDASSPIASVCPSIVIVPVLESIWESTSSSADCAAGVRSDLAN